MSVANIPTKFPDLLSFEELKGVLTEKYKNIPNIKKLKRDDLLVIFKEMLLPYPQRQYPANYRGRSLRERRLRLGLQTKCPTSARSNDTYLGTNNVNTSVDRLKPPPESNKNISLSKQSPVIDVRKRQSLSNQESNKSTIISGTQESESSSEGSHKPKRVKITWP